MIPCGLSSREPPCYECFRECSAAREVFAFLRHADVIATIHETRLTELGADFLTRRDKRTLRQTTQCAHRDEKESSSKRFELVSSDDLRAVDTLADLARVHLHEMTDFDSSSR